jgi:hypothetical protein
MEVGPTLEKAVRQTRRRASEGRERGRTELFFGG